MPAGRDPQQVAGQDGADEPRGEGRVARRIGSARSGAPTMVTTSPKIAVRAFRADPATTAPTTTASATPARAGFTAAGSWVAGASSG